jgi:hypothetical protein
MNIKFGVVENYLPDKGFGFVRNPLDQHKFIETFFHISTIKKSDLTVYRKLSIYTPSESLFFWYEHEKTPRGTQISRIIKKDELRSLLRSKFYGILLKNIYVPLIKTMWKEIEKEQPIWLEEISSHFIEEIELNKLKKERQKLIRQKTEADENRRIEDERLRKLEEEKEEKQREIERLAEQKENQEFELLVAEMKTKGFTSSAQVSNFIVINRLGDKYKHISGVLKMENDNSIWDFNGGFPPKIYAMLCEKLNLGNKGTSSRVINFTAFKDL